MAKGIYAGLSTPQKTIDFTTHPTPAIWADSSDGMSATGKNEYGEWSISATRISLADYKVSNAFDADSSTYYASAELSADSYTTYVQIDCPDGVSINPTGVTIRYDDCGNSSYPSTFQGYNGSSWENLYTLTNSSSVKQVEPEITTDKYYTKFRLKLHRYSSSSKYPTIYSFLIHRGSMIVPSTTDIARKVKKAYVGVASVARKVKKGYIGVAGVARPFFSAEQKLMYYGTATNLSATRISLAATSIGDYALFAGGTKKGADDCSAVVDTYSPTLVKGTATNLSKARQRLAATTVGDYALIGGGYGTGGTYTYMSSKVVDTYTSTLAKGTATALSKERADLAATTVGDYALFGGGEYSDSSGKNNYQQIVDTYSSTLAKGTATTLSSLGSMRAATTVGDYAIFAGGYVYQSSKAYFYSTVDAYSSSLVKKTATALSTKKADLVATTVGDHALFAGGYNDSARLATVETYTKDLVKGTVADLSNGKSSMAATTVGDYALIAGGYNSSALATVDTYTKDLVKGTTTDLSVARCGLAATTVGDYALFGGGGANFSTTTANKYATVDVYQLV